MDLERSAHAPARAVKQHALIAAAQAERVAHLIGAQARDVAHRGHAPLRHWQLLDRALPSNLS
jgi:hypothetical protein